MGERGGKRTLQTSVFLIFLARKKRGKSGKFWEIWTKIILFFFFFSRWNQKLRKLFFVARSNPSKKHCFKHQLSLFMFETDQTGRISCLNRFYTMSESKFPRNHSKSTKTITFTLPLVNASRALSLVKTSFSASFFVLRTGFVVKIWGAEIISRLLCFSDKVFELFRVVLEGFRHCFTWKRFRMELRFGHIVEQATEHKILFRVYFDNCFP